MSDRHCRYCQQVFEPAPYHPHQQVCSRPDCQQQRRRDYHQQKIASDPVYRQVCLDSPADKWRKAHRGYWKQYRRDHPQQVERNRQLQQLRDQKRRVRNVANNNLAFDLRRCAAEVWLLGPAVNDLVNNNLAASQLLILQPVGPPVAAGKASCKQHPSGLAPGAGL